MKYARLIRTLCVNPKAVDMSAVYDLVGASLSPPIFPQLQVLNWFTPTEINQAHWFMYDTINTLPIHLPPIFSPTSCNRLFRHVINRIRHLRFIDIKLVDRL